MPRSFDQYGTKVTFRVNREKDHVRQEFLDNVIDKQHSDICYVLTSLMEAYNLALKEAPPLDKVVLNMPRQNIQLNVGCNFHYHTAKARRTLPTSGLPEIETRKNLFFPLLLEEWGTLKPEQKLFWTERLREAGIIPPEDKPRAHPSASIGKRRRRKTNFLARVHRIVRHLTAHLGRGKKLRKRTPDMGQATG